MQRFSSDSRFRENILAILSFPEHDPKAQISSSKGKLVTQMGRKLVLLLKSLTNAPMKKTVGLIEETCHEMMRQATASLEEAKEDQSPEKIQQFQQKIRQANALLQKVSKIHQVYLSRSGRREEATVRRLGDTLFSFSTKIGELQGQLEPSRLSDGRFHLIKDYLKICSDKGVQLKISWNDQDYIATAHEGAIYLQTMGGEVAYEIKLEGSPPKSVVTKLLPEPEERILGDEALVTALQALVIQPSAEGMPDVAVLGSLLNQAKEHRSKDQALQIAVDDTTTYSVWTQQSGSSTIVHVEKQTEEGENPLNESLHLELRNNEVRAVFENGKRVDQLSVNARKCLLQLRFPEQDVMTQQEFPSAFAYIKNLTDRSIQLKMSFEGRDYAVTTEKAAEGDTIWVRPFGEFGGQCFRLRLSPEGELSDVDHEWPPEMLKNLNLLLQKELGTPPLSVSPQIVSPIVVHLQKFPEAFSGSIIHVGNNAYVVWKQKLPEGGMMLHMQEQSQFGLDSPEDRVSLEIGENGALIGVFENGNRSAELSDEKRRLVDYIATQVSTEYAVKGKIVIKTMPDTPRKFPWYHLEQLVTSIFRSSKTDPKLHVTFVDENLQKTPGSDRGGLSRSYIASIFEGIAASLHVQRLSLSALANCPSESLTCMGASLMWCFLSKNDSWLFDTTYPTGFVFDPELFQSVLSLTWEEASSAELSPELTESIINRVLESYAQNDPSWAALSKLRSPEASAEFLNQYTEQQQNVLQQLVTRLLTNDMDYEPGEGHESLIHALRLDDEEGIQNLDLLPKAELIAKRLHALLLKKEGRTTEEQQLVDDFRRYLGEQGGLFAAEKTQNLIPRARALWSIAHGMTKFIQPPRYRNPQQIWDQMTFEGFEAFSQKTQGELNREKVASSFIVQGMKHDWLQRRIEWLREWITDPSTDIEDVKKFLIFTTGTSSVPIRGITICKSHDLRAHVSTCACQLSLPQPAQKKDDATPEAKQDFIGAIKNMIIQPEDYSV